LIHYYSFLLENDKRMAKVTFDGRTYAAVLCDLPTIIESHKTSDRSQYVKIADIHQVLLVLDGSSESIRHRIEDLRQKDFILDDGLTPPMKNVRNRRFSKRNQENLKKMEEIERTVARLIEADSRAVSSNYVLYNSRNKPIATNHTTDRSKGRKKSVSSEFGGVGTDEEGNEEEAAFEESVQEAEDESGDSDFAAELEDNLMDELSQAEEAEETSAEPMDEDGMESTGEFASQMGDLTLGSQSTLPPALQQLRLQIQEKKAQLASVTNPAIKARLEDVIKYLETEFESKVSKL
jgi:transcription initiation factor TFIID subunit 7